MGRRSPCDENGRWATLQRYRPGVESSLVKMHSDNVVLYKTCAGSYTLINVYLCRFPVKCTKVTKKPWYCVRYTRTFNTPWIEKCHSSVFDENFLWYIWSVEVKNWPLAGLKVCKSQNKPNPWIWYKHISGCTGRIVHVHVLTKHFHWHQ